MIRTFVIVFCVVVAFPSVSRAGPNIALLERMVGYLSRSVEALKGLAADARVAQGAAKEEALVKGRAELAKLKPVFHDAQQEAERLEQQESMEKWRERIDRASDLVDAYRKVEELKELTAERDVLEDEFCGPRDFYRFSGGHDCDSK
jgi:hypothetical protein